jgi:hypothetical protein
MIEVKNNLFLPSKNNTMEQTLKEIKNLLDENLWLGANRVWQLLFKYREYLSTLNEDKLNAQTFGTIIELYVKTENEKALFIDELIVCQNILKQYCIEVIEKLLTPDILNTLEEHYNRGRGRVIRVDDINETTVIPESTTKESWWQAFNPFKKHPEERDIGKILYQIPTDMPLAEKNRCIVRIAPKELDNFLMNIIPSKDTKTQAIKMSNLMSVTIFESLEDGAHFKIAALNHEKQSIDKDDFTQWLFDITPLSIGQHALILRVTRHVFQEGDTISKDVLTLNREITVQSIVSETIIEEEYNPIVWNEDTRRKVSKLIRLNATGHALEVIANYILPTLEDTEFFNAILLLQSRWNFGFTNHTKGLMSEKDWWVYQAQINQATLQLVSDINSNFNDKQKIDNRKLALKKVVESL